MRAASSAEIMSPVSSISIAALRDTLRDSATIGVEQNNPILTPGVANLAASRGDGEIATRHQLAAGGRGGALDCGNNRLRQVDDLLHHAAAQPHDVREIAAPAVFILAVGIELFEIVAGGKGLPVRGEYHDMDRAILRDRGERIGQRFEGRFGQAVARLGPVEGQDGDAVPVLAQQDRRRRGGNGGGSGVHTRVQISKPVSEFRCFAVLFQPLYPSAGLSGR